MANTRTTTRSSRKAAPKRGARAKESDATADQLAASLDATARGLESFLESLRASGMPEALAGYRHLHVLLFQQRQWALGDGHGELGPRFAEISAAAAAIRDLLAPYAEVMGRIAEINAVGPARSDE